MKERILHLLFVLTLPYLAFSQSKEGFVEQLFLEGFEQPTCMDFAPDGRMFVSEKSGEIYVIENRSINPTPAITLDVDENGERGLGCLRLDPNFEQNGYLYVYYSVRTANHNRLSRFTMTGNSISTSSELVLLDLDPMLSSMHNGGSIRFQNDQTLFLTTGDGSNPGVSQDMTTNLGKVLRLNSDGTIPEDNPFFNDLSGDLRMIYALGLRNPYTSDYDPETERLFVNDVGNISWEEVNEISAGKNYGWHHIEGKATPEFNVPQNYEDPIYAFSHDVGCAVVGGAFYNPLNTNFPEEYKGDYFFAEWCSGIINVMDGTTLEVYDTLSFGEIWQPSCLVVNPYDGYLFAIKIYRGEIYRILYVGTGAPIISRQPHDAVIVEGEPSSLSVGAVGAEPLTYEWYKNSIPLSNSSATLDLSGLALSDDQSTYFCAVSNAYGTTYSDTITITVTDNQRPQPSISLMTPNTYTAGDTIIMLALGSDPEDGDLEASNFQWKVDLYHNDHFHPFLSWVSTDSLAVVTPVYGEIDTNVWYRIQLRATDSQGLTNLDTVDIIPKLITIRLQTSPESIGGINMDGTTYDHGAVIRSVAGMNRSLQIEPFILVEDSVYRFLSWNQSSDTTSLSIQAYSDTSITAFFEPTAPYFEGEGRGLLGTYYGGEEKSEFFEAQQIDAEIDLNWSWQPPTQGVPWRDYEITWTGFLLAPVSGTYTFSLTFGGEVELTLDDTLRLIAASSSNTTIEDNFTVYLEANTYYPIQIDYDKLGRTFGQIHMSWQHPYNDLEIVPSEQLYSYDPRALGSEKSAQALPLFPNPATDKITIRTNSSYFINLKTTLSLFTMDGSLIETWVDEFNGNELVIPLYELVNGQYLLRIEDASGHFEVLNFYKD